MSILSSERPSGTVWYRTKPIFMLVAFISVRISLQFTHHQDSQVYDLNLSDFGKFFPGWNRSLMGLFLVGGFLIALLVCQCWEEGLSLPDLPCLKNIQLVYSSGAQTTSDMTFSILNCVTQDTAAVLEAHKYLCPGLFLGMTSDHHRLFVSPPPFRRDTEATTCHWDVPGQGTHLLSTCS